MARARSRRAIAYQEIDAKQVQDPHPVVDEGASPTHVDVVLVSGLRLPDSSNVTYQAPVRQQLPHTIVASLGVNLENTTTNGLSQMNPPRGSARGRPDAAKNVHSMELRKRGPELGGEEPVAKRLKPALDTTLDDQQHIQPTAYELGTAVETPNPINLTHVSGFSIDNSPGDDSEHSLQEEADISLDVLDIAVHCLFFLLVALDINPIYLVLHHDHLSSNDPNQDVFEENGNTLGAEMCSAILDVATNHLAFVLFLFEIDTDAFFDFVFANSSYLDNAEVFTAQIPSLNPIPKSVGEEDASSDSDPESEDEDEEDNSDSNGLVDWALERSPKEFSLDDVKASPHIVFNSVDTPGLDHASICALHNINVPLDEYLETATTAVNQEPGPSTAIGFNLDVELWA
jgi:hypothetical protein